MDEHKDFYTTFCQPQFAKLFEKVEAVERLVNERVSSLHEILKGKNGQPGLCDDIRSLKNLHEKKADQSKFLKRAFVGAVIVQILIIGRQIFTMFWAGK